MWGTHLPKEEWRCLGTSFSADRQNPSDRYSLGIHGVGKTNIIRNLFKESPPGTVVATTLKVALIIGPGLPSHTAGTFRPFASQLTGVVPFRAANADNAAA